MATDQTGVARDFLIDLETHELVVGSDGDWVLAVDLDAIKQDAHTALGFILGEWAFDTTQGFDLFGKVLVKTPNEGLIRAEVTRVLLTVRGIVAVSNVAVRVNTQTREALITWSASTSVGELRNQTTRLQS